MTRRAKRDSRRMTYRLRSPIVMRGATLSLLGSARRDCGFASAPATRKSCGNPPLGGFSVTVSPSRCKTARCAGPFARRILLSEPEPTLLSPGCSHSSPTSESQPSGFKSSAACWVRQAARSLSKLPVWARSAAASKSPVRPPCESRDRKRIRKYNSGMGGCGCRRARNCKSFSMRRRVARCCAAATLSETSAKSVCFPERWPSGADL